MFLSLGQQVLAGRQSARQTRGAQSQEQTVRLVSKIMIYHQPIRQEKNCQIVSQFVWKNLPDY